MKLYKLTTDLYLDKQLEKMNEILLIENLIDLGLEYTEVNYLCKLTQSMTIEHKKGFFIKVAKYEIKNEDRDVYSMSGKSKGILKDIYHDKNFQRSLTRMFLKLKMYHLKTKIVACLMNACVNSSSPLDSKMQLINSIRCFEIRIKLEYLKISSFLFAFNYIFVLSGQQSESSRSRPQQW